MNQQKLPNATAVLILGITSFIGCCFTNGILGLVLGGIGLYLANKDTKLYNQNPDLYDNYSTLNIGKVLNIIGIVFGLLAIASFLVMLSMYGFEAIMDQDLMREKIQESFGQ